jgi:hypothetical protein
MSRTRGRLPKRRVVVLSREWGRSARLTDFKAKGDVEEVVEALEVHATLFDYRIPRLWKMVENCLRDQTDYVAGLRLERNANFRGGEGRGDVLLLQWRRELSESWSGLPTIILDATAKPELVAPYLTHAPYFVDLAVNPPHQRITQVADCAFSKKMFVGGGGGQARRAARKENVDRLRNLIKAKAYQHCGRAPGRVDVLVVAQQEVEKALNDGGVPNRVAIRHFNDIAGEDIYGQVACVIVVGRTLPNTSSIEAMTEILTGRSVPSANASSWPIEWRSIVGNEGPLFSVQGPSHPDATAEAARWSIAEGNVIQAMGRARATNRGPDDPVEILLLTDLSLPLVVDRVVTWGEVQINRFQQAFMLGNGTMPTSASELERVYGPNGTSGRTLWPTADAAKKDAKAHGKKGVKALLDSLIELSPPYSVEYRRERQRGRWSRALVASADPAIARAELEVVVGPVAGFRMGNPLI